jgi:hypothetical protein
MLDVNTGKLLDWERQMTDPTSRQRDKRTTFRQKVISGNEPQSGFNTLIYWLTVSRNVTSTWTTKTAVVWNVAVFGGCQSSHSVLRTLNLVHSGWITSACYIFWKCRRFVIYVSRFLLTSYLSPIIHYTLCHKHISQKYNSNTFVY